MDHPRATSRLRYMVVVVMWCSVCTLIYILFRWLPIDSFGLVSLGPFLFAVLMWQYMWLDSWYLFLTKPGIRLGVVGHSSGYVKGTVVCSVLYKTTAVLSHFPTS